MPSTTEELLDRAASVYLPAGMSSGEKAALAFRVNQGHATSPEILNSIATSGSRVNGDVDELARLFFLVFDRAPDLAGFQLGISALNKGFSLKEISAFIMNLGTSVYSPAQTNQEFVNAIARQMFSDPASVPGLSLTKAVLTAELNNGTLSREGLLEAVSRISAPEIKYDSAIEISLAMIVGAGREATSEDFYTLNGQTGLQLMRSALTLGNEEPYGTQPYFAIGSESLSVTNQLSEAFTFNLKSSTISNASGTSFSFIVTRDGGLTESPTTYRSGVINGVKNLDLSMVTGAGTNHVVYANDAGSVITGPTVGSTFYGANGIDIIVGGAGDDVIYGGANSDQLTGGEGSDEITGGDGVDAIALVELVSASDTVKLGAVAASADTISGFDSGSDVIDLSLALGAGTLTIGTQIPYTPVKATNIAAITTAADTDAPVYYLANTASGLGEMTLAEVEAAIVAGSSATGEAVVLVDNGQDTLIYIDAAAEAVPSSGAGDGLILIGTLLEVTGSTALATGDLISI